MNKKQTVMYKLAKLFPLPSQLELERGTKEFRRVRALTVMLVTVTGTTLFWTLVVMWMHFFTEKQFYENLVAAFIILFIFVVQTFCLYFFANIRISAMFLTMSYFFVVVGIIFISGGYDSPNKILLLSCPIISFRIGGRDEGFANTVFAGIVGLLFILAKSQGFIIESMVQNLGEYFSAAMAWIVSLTVVVACLASYDWDE